MRKFCSIVFLFIIYYTSIYAQDNERSFRLTISEPSVVKNSLYDKIDFIDNRSDYEFDKIKINRISFIDDLTTLLKKITDESAQNYTILLQLRNLGIYKENKENYLHLRMSLYEKNDNDYYFINTFDAKVPLEKSNEYEDIVSEDIRNFLAENLNTLEITPETAAYSVEDVNNIDLFEKKDIKVYNTNILTDGIYLTHKDFLEQTPLKKEFKANFKKRELKDIKIINSNNKEQKISAKDVFMVVVNGQFYVSNGKKYIEGYRDNDDLYFEDEVSESHLGVSPAFSIGIGSGGYRGGGFGIGLSTVSHKKRIIYKIDHLSDLFVPQ